MKLSTTLFFCAVGMLLSVCAISSCSREKTIEGAWEGPPQHLDVPGAVNALATVTLDFGSPAQSTRAGNINISAVINLDEQAFTTHPAIEHPWQASIAATASISGRYVAEDNDGDDIIISLDPSTLTVTIDPAGLVYDQNALTGDETASLDSLSAATASRWRVTLTNVMREQFYNLSHIEDIKIHHGDLLSAEINDRDCTFRKVQ